MFVIEAVVFAPVSLIIPSRRTMPEAVLFTVIEPLSPVFTLPKDVSLFTVKSESVIRFVVAVPVSAFKLRSVPIVRVVPLAAEISRVPFLLSGMIVQLIFVSVLRASFVLPIVRGSPLIVMLPAFFGSTRFFTLAASLSVIT